MSEWVTRSGIQLAYPFEEKRLLKWTPPFILQPKLDGDRCRAVIDDLGVVTLYSSEEHTLHTIPHIQAELENSGLRDVELDGELYIHRRPQAEVHGMVSSQRGDLHEEYHKVTYQLFDLIDETAPQNRRLFNLHQLFADNLSKSRPLGVVPFYIVNTLEEIYEANEWFISLGYEGFILRKYDEFYRRKRSIYMMKFKPKKSDIYLIIGVNEAIDKCGSPKGMVGSFQCASPPKLGNFPVGAGKLTHEERLQYWEIKEDLIGHYLLVEFQHLTSKNGVPRSGVAVKVITQEEKEKADDSSE